MKEIKVDIDARLDRMIVLAEICGVSLDEIVAAIGRIDQSTFDRVSGNPSLLPRYMKSKEMP